MDYWTQNCKQQKSNTTYVLDLSTAACKLFWNQQKHFSGWKRWRGLVAKSWPKLFQGVEETAGLLLKKKAILRNSFWPIGKCKDIITNYFKIKQNFRCRKKKKQTKNTTLYKEATERNWLDSAGSSVQVQKEQNVLLFGSKKMRCYPQDGDSRQCLNLQSSASTHRHLNAAAVSFQALMLSLSDHRDLGYHEAATTVVSGTKLKKLFLNIWPCVCISKSCWWSALSFSPLGSCM